MRWIAKRNLGGILSLLLLGLSTGCAKPEYVGNSSKGFWSEQPAEISPTQAYAKAQPHLEATWAVRCDQVRNQDEWCDKPPLDHMMRKGKWYFVTRTAYPHRSHGEFLNYAVKINADNGQVVPLESGADTAESEESAE